MKRLAKMENLTRWKIEYSTMNRTKKNVTVKVSSKEVKALGMSKWSDNLDEDDTGKYEGVRNVISLSGLIQAYKKGGKYVRWADQVGNTGFLIGAAKKATSSLFTGPGAGCNSVSDQHIIFPVRLIAGYYEFMMDDGYNLCSCKSPIHCPRQIVVYPPVIIASPRNKMDSTIGYV